MAYWQVGAGAEGRDYSEIFLQYGVMLVGPGDPGDYFNNIDKYQDEKFVRYGEKIAIRDFSQNVKDGDNVVLKKPTGLNKWLVYAVGKVKNEYKYLPEFDDVEGWDLQHCRMIEWRKPKKDIVIAGLTRGMFKGIAQPDVQNDIDNIFRSAEGIHSKKLPKKVERLNDEILIEILIDFGLRPKDAEDFANTITRIRRLIRWYTANGKDIMEHETRTFLIIPLLIALGWPEQKLKVEWKNIDIAFFNKPYSRYNEKSIKCIGVLESKKLWEGLFYAENQVKAYATKYPDAKNLIVSDGCCYKLFKRKDTRWNYEAYLNILKPKLRHPYREEIGGAPDVFLSLMHGS